MAATPQQWTQLHLYTVAQYSEQLEAALLEAGALTITLQDSADQPVLEPGVGETPLWDSIHISALFDAGSDPQQLLQSLQSSCPDATFSHRFETLADDDWERACLDQFQPMRFGQRLWICPSWSSPPDPDGVTLSLDPGLAFGTGSHPTTALCLEWLDANKLEKRLIVDYGCGSGILAIAALLLGAKHAIAIDNDPQALLATRQNAAENNIPDDSLTTCSPEDARQHLTRLGAQRDAKPIVLANILAGTLVDLAPTIKPLLNAGSVLVMSGILADQVTRVKASYENIIDFRPPEIRDGWARLDGSRKAKPGQAD